MRTRRSFTRAFKIGVVQDVMRGDEPIAVICRGHAIDPNVVLRWRHEVETRGADAFIPSVAAQGDANLLRIAELERLCGQQALEIQTLKKGLQLMREQTGTRS